MRIIDIDQLLLATVDIETESVANQLHTLHIYDIDQVLEKTRDE